MLYPLLLSGLYANPIQMTTPVQMPGRADDVLTACHRLRVHPPTTHVSENKDLHLYFPVEGAGTMELWIDLNGDGVMQGWEETTHEDRLNHMTFNEDTFERWSTSEVMDEDSFIDIAIPHEIAAKAPETTMTFVRACSHACYTEQLEFYQEMCMNYTFYVSLKDPNENKTDLADENAVSKAAVAACAVVGIVALLGGGGYIIHRHRRPQEEPQSSLSREPIHEVYESDHDATETRTVLFE